MFDQGSVRCIGRRLWRWRPSWASGQVRRWWALRHYPGYRTTAVAV